MDLMFIGSRQNSLLFKTLAQGNFTIESLPLSFLNHSFQNPVCLIIDWKILKMPNVSNAIQQKGILGIAIHAGKDDLEELKLAHWPNKTKCIVSFQLNGCKEINSAIKALKQGRESFDITANNLGLDEKVATFKARRPNLNNNQLNLLYEIICINNISAAAKNVGISRSTIHRHLQTMVVIENVNTKEELIQKALKNHWF